MRRIGRISFGALKPRAPNRAAMPLLLLAKYDGLTIQERHFKAQERDLLPPTSSVSVTTYPPLQRLRWVADSEPTCISMTDSHHYGLLAYRKSEWARFVQ